MDEVRAPRILILILAVNFEPWSQIESKGQAPTWVETDQRNVRIVRYVGNLGYSHLLMVRVINFLWGIRRIIKFTARLRGIGYPSLLLKKAYNNYLNSKLITVTSTTKDEIQVDVPDIYPLIGLKTSRALLFCLKNFDFDYIYRTNVSSYVSIERLIHHISTVNKENYYAGVMGVENGIEFASGSGYLLSKDALAAMAPKFMEWDHLEIDDVSLGAIAKAADVGITVLNRLDITHEASISESEVLGREDTFHFRCKSDNYLETIKIMKSLDSILKNKA